MDKFDFFWKTMELCDWDKEGNDQAVLMPVVDHLSKMSDDDIFRFDDLMAELLYRIDTRENARKQQEIDGFASDDGFLYSRCVALINGPEYYEDVLAGRITALWEMEFESLLYVPMEAWAVKHNKLSEDYPHVTEFCIETGSNEECWGE